MASKPGKTNELWSELFQSENHQNHLENQGIYQRRRPQQMTQELTDALLNRAGSTGPSRVSFVPANFEKKRISWNRSLCTKGEQVLRLLLVLTFVPTKSSLEEEGNQQFQSVAWNHECV